MLNVSPGISEFNPPLKVRIHSVAGKRVIVIRDDLLGAGTKQRYLPLYLSHPKFDDVTEFVYAGSSKGFGQIGLAYAAKLLGKKATIFVQDYGRDDTVQTKRARTLGATIKGPYRKTITELKKIASSYIKASPNRAWGLATDSRESDAVLLLSAQIRAAFDASVKTRKSLRTNPGRVFVVGGTAIIYTALKRAMPDKKFVIVQVGKKIWDDQVFEGDEVFVSPYKFNEVPSTDRRPSYPSAANYDAKIFDAVAALGEDGDWIWNIAGD